MKPTYSMMRINYPYRELYHRGMLLALLGWDDLLENESYKDTCAMRMSYALARSGVRLVGARMKGKGKTVNGLPIEPGQAKLSQILLRMWGKPEKYRGETAARAGIGKRAGVVSFFRIHPNVDQGHIDLVEPRANGFAECAVQCYFEAREVWFWPLR
jgi:hypothetical protein